MENPVLLMTIAIVTMTRSAFLIILTGRDL